MRDRNRSTERSNTDEKRRNSERYRGVMKNVEVEDSGRREKSYIPGGDEIKERARGGYKNMKTGTGKLILLDKRK